MLTKAGCTVWARFAAVWAIGLGAIGIGHAAEREAALLRQAREIFRAWPGDRAKPATPLTWAGVELGRMLFFDPRLTIDGNVACATCHQPALYGTDSLPTSIGVRQRVHKMNAPTVLNAAA